MSDEEEQGNGNGLTRRGLLGTGAAAATTDGGVAAS